MTFRRTGDAVGRARTESECDVGHGQKQCGRSGSVGLMNMDAIAQGQTVSTPSLLSRKSNLVPSSGLASLRQALSSAAVGKHEPVDAGAARAGCPIAKVELRHSDIDQHQAGRGVEKGIAGEAQGRHINSASPGADPV